MPSKVHLFEDLPAPEIELDLYYTYYFKEGKISGRPEDCFPDEEEMEIVLPEGYEQTIMDAYTKSAREAIKQIESEVSDLEFHNMPRKWAEEECIDLE